MAEIKTPGLDEIISGNTKPISTPGLDQLINSATAGAAPIREDTGTPRTIEDITGRANKPEYQPSPSLPTSGYMRSVGEAGAAALDQARTGLSNIGEGKPATGVGQIGLGAISFPLAVVTGGIHEFVGKPATALGGSQFGDKAEMLAGAAVPLGLGGRAIAKRLPTNTALDAITSSVAPAELAEGLQRLKSNPNLSVMDVFPSVKQMGQKLVLTEGMHQNKFAKFIEDRIGGRKNAIEEIYKDTMGAPPDVLLKLNQLKSNIKAAGKEINPIIATANPVDVSGVIANIDAKLKPGVTSKITAGEPLPLSDTKKELALVRKYLTNDKSNRIDASTLHDFQSAIRATADNLMNSGKGSDRSQGYHLMSARNDLVNAIEEAAPGYKAKLAGYRDEYQVQDAFNKGYLITKNRPGVWDDRPEFWQEWVKGASKEEREAAREGARVAFNDVVNGTRFAGRKGMDIPEVPFNREKIEMLFGKKQTDEMASRLRDERGISETNSDILKGSQTAMRNKSNSNVTDPNEIKFKGLHEMALPAAIAEAASVAGLGNYPGVATMALTGGSIAKRLTFDKGVRQYARAKNDRLTDLLTATGSERDELIKMLEASLPQAKLTSGQKLRLMIGNP